MVDLTDLIHACEDVVKLPAPIPESEAEKFVAEHPLDAVFG